MKKWLLAHWPKLYFFLFQPGPFEFDRWRGHIERLSANDLRTLRIKRQFAWRFMVWVHHRKPPTSKIQWWWAVIETTMMSEPWTPVPRMKVAVALKHLEDNGCN